MKMGMILIGEAFRLGGQGTRNRDSEASYMQQKRACESHVAFADFISGKGLEIDVLIESYSTRYESDLRSWYGDRLKKCWLRNDLVGLRILGRDSLFKVEGYDCVLVCRIDLALKRMFMEIFDPNWQKVMFPSACWVSECRCGNFPRISDTMMFIPSKFLDPVRRNFFLYHTAWADYVNSRALKNEDFGLMLDTYHDSDSAKDYNPIYRIVNRHESKFWHSLCCEVGDNFMPVQNWKKKRFPDWSPKDMLRQDKAFQGNMWEWWHKDPFMDAFRFINLIRFEDSGGVGYYDHRDQRYWRMEGDSMVIMDENKKVSSVLHRVSDEIYSGKFEFNNGMTFMIRKAKPEEWLDRIAMI